jgi:hypothetical protein
MKTVLDSQARQELTGRLEQMKPDSHPLWGKMTAPQMVKHLRLWEEMIHENKRYPRPLIGRLIGPLILKRVLKNPDFPKNTPTIPEMRMSEINIDLMGERQKLISLLNSYATYDLPDYSFIHPFFGKMKRDQIGVMAYKHMDHHLQQFGV